VTSPMLAAALDYAAMGWPVFPVSPDDKRAMVREWQNVASTDAAQITTWWTKWPKAMIGSLQGANGCFAIDFDILNKDTGEVFEPEDLKAALEEDACALPVTRIAQTGSGGWHLYFEIPRGASVPRKIRRLPQTDICGEKGYTILPPSVRSTGAAYTWLNNAEIAEAPAELVAWISAKKERDDHSSEAAMGTPVEHPAPSGDERVNENRRKYAYAALANATHDVSTCGAGGRNQALNNAALALGNLVGAGLLSEGVVRAALFDAAAACGLVKDDGADGVRKTISSGLSAGVRSPTDLTNIGTRVVPSRERVRAGPPARPFSSTPHSSQSPAPSGDVLRSGGSHWEGQAPQDQFSGGAGAAREVERNRKKKAWRFSRNLTCATLPVTDLGNAQRFVERFGKKFFWVEQWGWLAWDGRRWNTREAEAILSRAVHMTIKGISAEANVLRSLGDAFDGCGLNAEGAKLDVDAPDDLLCWNPVVDVKKGHIIRKADRISGWAISSQSNAHITCIARLAQAYLTATPDMFDADLCAFNVANGTLRFKKNDDGKDYVSFERHNRADMMTRIADIEYDPFATAPVYDAFLAKVQPDADMRRHLHAWGGVSLTGLPLARMAFWYGKGRNGKSTCIDAWAFVIGEYSQTIPIESFLDQGRSRRGGEASPDIASLPGVRCLRTSEPEKGAQLAESLVKLVTGGEPLRARHLNKDFFEFRPAFKLTMQGNYRPNVTGTDEGFWRRMLLVPWSVTIGEGEVDVALPDKLKAEASGILNRLLDGLRDYLDNGVSPTAEIVEATEAYRSDSDPVGRFLRECTIDVPPAVDAAGKKHDSRVGGKELYETYVAWAKAEGEKPWLPKGFSRGLQDHGIKRLKSSGIFYLGITLIKFAAEFEGMEIEVQHDKKSKTRSD
jgi:putative DNA primase/helicase